MKHTVHRFVYMRDKPMSIKLLGVLAAVFSVGGLATTPAFGLIAGLGAAALLLYRTGIEVDLDARTFRFFSALGSARSGEWRAIPALKCVSVFKVKVVSRIYGRSNASITTRQNLVQVNLVTAENKRVLLFESENREDAVNVAKQIGLRLNERVWDASEGAGRWMELS